MPGADPREELVLVLAPTGRDARLIADELDRHGVDTLVCQSLDRLCAEIDLGAGTAVVAEEALPPAVLPGLVAALGRQPPWSDLPFLVLTGQGSPTAASVRRFEALEPVANVTQFERPVRTRTLLSAVRAALRSRRRQYDVRGHLAERERLMREMEAERAGLAEVFRDAPSFLCVLRGPDHVFERANRRYVELVGGRDVLGRPVREALPEVAGQGFLDTLDRVYRTGEPFVSSNTRITLDRPGGPEERVLEFVYQPLRDAADRVTGILVNGVDLTDREHAQEAHRRSEGRYRVLVTASSDVVYRMSADWAEMYPLDGRDLVASSTEPVRDWMRVNIPDFERGRVTAAIGAAIRDKAVFELEHQVLRPDGTLGWTYSRAAPILDARGEIAEWFGTARDVTDRKRAERELARLAEALGLAIAAADLGTWEWDPATDQIVLSVRAGEIYGIDPAGPHHREALRRLLHPDDRGPARSAARRAAADRTDYDIEYRLTRDGGEPAWVAVRGRGVYDAGGRLTRMLGVAQDVTARKRAEEALRASEERYRALFTSIDEGFCVIEVLFDPAAPGRAVDYLFLEVNPAFEAQAGLRDAVGRRMLEFVPSIDDHWLTSYGRVALTGEPTRFANEYKTLNRWFDVYAFRVGPPDARRVAVLFTDITPRKRAEAERERLVEQLRDADRRKDEFLALLAHELRNPLAPVRNGLQVLRLSPDRAARERAQAMMDRQLGHMVRLIDDLLDVSRISRNKMELRRARLALADVVSSAVETVRPAVDAAGHELSVSLPDEPLYLDADLTRLAQVFGNLLGNSAKYTPPGGRIRLHAVADGGHVTVTVSDNGIGIPAESLPTIFDMFSQVDRSLERSTGGLGIGLALVKGLVEMHGGTVTAASDGPGRGSAFSVRLPLFLPSLAATNPVANAAVPPAGAGRRILVVDDNRDSAESMAEMLKLLGYDVAVAHDGLEAVEQAERVRPALVLMDVGMPRLNGLEATRRIRERPWGHDAVIVALTGWGQDGDRARSKEAGCDGHLVKPISLTDLQSVLGQI